MFSNKCLWFSLINNMLTVNLQKNKYNNNPKNIFYFFFSEFQPKMKTIRNIPVSDKDIYDGGTDNDNSGMSYYGRYTIQYAT